MTAPRQYALKETIGTGAHGVVWRAESPLGEIVACKVFQPDPYSSDTSTDRQRFIKEIHTQSTLKHPRIVSVIEEGQTPNGDPFYAMELADESLQKRIDKSSGGLPRQDALSIFEKVCSAIAYAHRQGVLHRDLKPSNILMYGDEPRVADFGLGRDLLSATETYTQSKFMQGSHGYMAPEQQASLHAAEKPADVYALGKILYHMLTRSNPISVDLTKLPDDLQFLVYSCVHEKPEDRFEDCEILANRLTALNGADPSALAPPTDQAKAALSELSDGDADAINKLVEILISFPNDSALYMNFLPTIPKAILVRIAIQKPAQARKLIENFDAYAADNTSFSYADTIADILDPLFRTIEDPTVRRNILVRLVHQGADNNRFYVGEKFASMCSFVWSTPMYAEIIADILSKHSTEKGFFVPYLEKYSMPQVVRAALAA